MIIIAQPQYKVTKIDGSITIAIYEEIGIQDVVVTEPQNEIAKVDGPTAIVISGTHNKGSVARNCLFCTSYSCITGR